MELVCKPKEVAVCPDRSDLTPPLQNEIGLDEYVLSVYQLHVLTLSWHGSTRLVRVQY